MILSLIPSLIWLITDYFTAPDRVGASPILNHAFSVVFICLYPLCTTSVTLLLVKTCYNKLGGLNWIGGDLFLASLSSKRFSIYPNWLLWTVFLNCGAILLNTAPTVLTGSDVFGSGYMHKSAQSGCREQIKNGFVCICVCVCVYQR